MTEEEIEEKATEYTNAVYSLLPRFWILHAKHILLYHIRSAYISGALIQKETLKESK